MEASDSLPEFREWIFFIPFPFPNFGNGFFSFPSLPEFREWIFFIPFPFPNPQKSFPLTPVAVHSDYPVCPSWISPVCPSPSPAAAAPSLDPGNEHLLLPLSCLATCHPCSSAFQSCPCPDLRHKVQPCSAAATLVVVLGVPLA